MIFHIFISMISVFYLFLNSNNFHWRSSPLSWLCLLLRSSLRVYTLYILILNTIVMKKDNEIWVSIFMSFDGYNQIKRFDLMIKYMYLCMHVWVSLSCDDCIYTRSRILFVNCCWDPCRLRLRSTLSFSNLILY